ncbi:MAG: hypothetical protein AAGU75_13175 [Bacillota bacterium]
MKTVVPIRNKQAVKEFIGFTNQAFSEAGGNFGSILTDTNGMMNYMKLLGYQGDIDELIKDMITQCQKTELYESNGKIRTVGYCCTPAFAAIYKLQDKLILVPVPAPEPIMVDKFPFH